MSCDSDTGDQLELVPLEDFRRSDLGRPVRALCRPDGGRTGPCALVRGGRRRAVRRGPNLECRVAPAPHLG